MTASQASVPIRSKNASIFERWWSPTIGDNHQVDVAGLTPQRNVVRHGDGADHHDPR